MRDLVLIIEHDRELALTMDFYLRRARLRVLLTDSAAEGIEAAVRDDPGVVLVDPALPDRPGLDVCRALRADARTADTPILVCSPLSHEDDLARAFAAGANDYIVKPFGMRELILRVAELMVRARAEVR